MADTDSLEVIREKLDFAINPQYQACGCMGPQGDDPHCPCLMQNIIKYRGSWIRLERIIPGAPSWVSEDD